jgi:hypothetical protein
MYLTWSTISFSVESLITKLAVFPVTDTWPKVLSRNVVSVTMSSIDYGYSNSDFLYLASDLAVSLGKRDRNDKPLSNK